ncbi:hypothetical protein [Streptomyces angustmyceticus]|uniref:hypothetical protein n=1 Tax=Streptomyces angustmyceticus TaxID=285578 RepID=UPI00382C0A71
MHRLIAGLHNARRRHLPRNESCEDCGGSGANSSGKTCGTCNGLGEIHCHAGRRESRALSHSVMRKEGHRWPTL